MFFSRKIWSDIKKMVETEKEKQEIKLLNAEKIWKEVLAMSDEEREKIAEADEKELKEYEDSLGFEANQELGLAAREAASRSWLDLLKRGKSSSN